MRFPCSVSISVRSVSIFMMIAVEDIASAPPSAKAPARLTSKNPPMTKPAASVNRIVRTTCDPPSPSTSLRIACSRVSENSSPIENIRKTTPNSAR